MNLDKVSDWHGLQASWQVERPADDLTTAMLEMRVQLDKQRATTRTVVDTAITASGVSVGGWLANSSDTFNSRLGMATIVFTLAVSAVGWLARRGAVDAAANSVAGMLRVTLLRLQKELRYTRAGYAACVIGVLFSVFIFVSPDRGDRPKPRMVTPLFGLGWSSAFAVGLMIREKRLRAELQRFQRFDSSLSEALSPCSIVEGIEEAYGSRARM